MPLTTTLCLSWGVYFTRALFCTTLPGQVRAIALERNELEALLFDMNSAPNKKHGELLDKCVSRHYCCVCVCPVSVVACFCYLTPASYIPALLSSVSRYRRGR